MADHNKEDLHDMYESSVQNNDDVGITNQSNDCETEMSITEFLAQYKDEAKITEHSASNDIEYDNRLTQEIDTVKEYYYKPSPGKIPAVPVLIESVDRSSQTVVELLSSSVFKDFSIESLKNEEEDGKLITVDDLHNLDTPLEEWPVLMVSQLGVRDAIIDRLTSAITDLLDKARQLEQDIDFMQLKNLELNQIAEERNKECKESCSQTTEEDLADAWNKWYQTSYYQRVESSTQYTAHVKQAASLYSLTSIQQPPEITNLLESESSREIKLEGVKENNITSSKTEKKVLETTKKLPKENKSLKTESSLNAKHEKRKGRKKDKIVEITSKCISTGSVDDVKEAGVKESSSVGWDISKAIIAVKESDSGAVSGENKSAAVGWNVSGAVSIADQVKYAAEEASYGGGKANEAYPVPAGYVYDEQHGLYYDYASGYYYNAECCLYYDAKSGTYFYYDHESQSYKFHSQHPVVNNDQEQQTKTQKEKNNKKAKVKLSEVKCSEKEEGEVSDGEDIVIGDEGDTHTTTEENSTIQGTTQSIQESLQEEEENPPDLPSVYLTVLESENDVINVGSVQRITVSGGTIGSLHTNHIHFPDSSINQVHAEITYKCEEPDDHCFFLSDLASTKGTFINGARLSEEGLVSQPVQIKHGWLLEFGWVQVKCHVHLDSEVCDKCKSGLLSTEIPAAVQLPPPPPVRLIPEDIPIPPSLRLMVVGSECETVGVGTLFLVTLTGATVGQESHHLVHLDNITISKNHAEISYSSDGPDDYHYFVKDLGSKTGTFVNGARLSKSFVTSESREIGHGFNLRFGDVELKCHIHPGHLTCNECEPGLVLPQRNAQSGGIYKNIKPKEKDRRKKLKALQKKYGITTRDEKVMTAGQYVDRAHDRQKKVGSDNPYEKTEVASSETALSSKNKGFGMLKKMGWSEGTGLGKSQTGRVEPVNPTQNIGHSGLGSLQSTSIAPTPLNKRKRKTLEITKERYTKAKLLPAKSKK